jgi:hypothetical protein
MIDNLSNRQRESLRELKQFRKEEAERLRLEKLEAERPLREAAETLSRNYGSLLQLEQERERSYLIGNVPDPHRWIDDSVVGPDVRMTKAKADEFNLAESRKFRDSHPDVYLGDEGIAMVCAYIEKEGLKLISASMIERIVQRLTDAGLWPDKPAEPEPELEPVIEPERVAVPVVPDTFEGRDLSTGEMRTYTKWEVEHMDSETYRKVFRLGRVMIPYKAGY